MFDRTRTTARAAGALRLLVLGMAAASTAAMADTLPVSPRATYLRTNQDSPLTPTIVTLSSVGVSAGDWVQLTALGDFSVGNGFADAYVSMTGVFAGGNQLLATSELHRVSLALEAGTDYVTDPTWFGSLPTDIGEDFAIGMSPTQRSVTLQVPAGATHLFAGVLDSFFGDNTDADDDLAVGIARVPEPASIGLVGLTGLMLCRRR